MSEFPSAAEYAAEPVAYPALTVLNVRREGVAIDAPYRNLVVNRVNDDCLRLASFEGDYRWHQHPRSDELFLVAEGTLEIDLADGRTLVLGTWDMVTIPAGTVHRTRAVGRVVNLCFEQLGAETVFLEDPRTPTP
jgi:mannose-6-phosphate isomerase-like protein (cupin superfamily)